MHLSALWLVLAALHPTTGAHGRMLGLKKHGSLKHELVPGTGWSPASQLWRSSGGIGSLGIRVPASSAVNP